VLARLNKIGTITGAIERNLALLAAALGADASVNRGTKTFLFAEIADGAGHISIMALRGGVAP